MTAVHSTPRTRAGAGSRLLAIVLLGMVAVAFALHRSYRAEEVRLSGVLVRMVTSAGVDVVAERETIYFGLGSDTAFGLRMTPECSSIFLVLPLLVAAAAMIALRPRITRRVLGALLVAATAVVLVNQLRVLTLVGLINWLGTDRGYYWGHTLLGSMVSVFGGAIALVLFVWLATRSPRSWRHTDPGEEYR